MKILCKLLLSYLCVINLPGCSDNKSSDRSKDIEVPVDKDDPSIKAEFNGTGPLAAYQPTDQLSPMELLGYCKSNESEEYTLKIYDDGIYQGPLSGGTGVVQFKGNLLTMIDPKHDDGIEQARCVIRDHSFQPNLFPSDFFASENFVGESKVVLVCNGLPYEQSPWPNCDEVIFGRRCDFELNCPDTGSGPGGDEVPVN